MIVCVCDRLIVCFRSKLDSLFVCLRSNFEIAVCVTGFVGVLIELDWFSGLERGEKKKLWPRLNVAIAALVKRGLRPMGLRPGRSVFSPMAALTKCGLRLWS